MAKKGIVIIFSAPSGTGKTTILKRILALSSDVAFSVSTTTRPPRENEVDGKDYHFVGQSRFEEMISAGEFLEWVKIYGNYYGTVKSHFDELLMAGITVLVDTDTIGAMRLKEVIDCATVFVAPPSMNQLSTQLRKRKTETEETFHRRLDRAPKEIRSAHRYDYLVFNRDPEESARNVLAIITAEKCRMSRNLEELNTLIEDKSND